MQPVFKVIITSLLVNSCLVIFKLSAGLIFNLKTLIADALHSLSDMITDLIALLGQRMSSSKSDYKHPYGHGKFEYITSIIIGLIILLLGLSLIYKAIILKEQNITNSYLVMGVILFIIIIKYSLAKYIIKAGQNYRNNILMASGTESLMDVLSSIAVLIVVLLYQLTPIIPIFRFADKIGCLIISIFILKTALSIIKVNIITLLGEQENDEIIINKIKTIILNVEGVKVINELRLMKYGSYYKALIKIGIKADITLQESDQVVNLVERTLIKSNNNIKYVMVQVSPYEKY